MLEEMPERMFAAGKVKGRQEGIITILEVRFKKVPEEIENKLTLISREKNLKALVKKAATVKSLEQFQTALNKIPIQAKEED